jgi:hypothetical protein
MLTFNLLSEQHTCIDSSNLLIASLLSSLCCVCALCLIVIVCKGIKRGKKNPFKVLSSRARAPYCLVTFRRCQSFSVFVQVEEKKTETPSAEGTAPAAPDAAAATEATNTAAEQPDLTAAVHHPHPHIEL